MSPKLLTESSALPRIGMRPEPHEKQKRVLSLFLTLAKLDAIVLTDDTGGGYTYFKLCDLGGLPTDFLLSRGRPRLKENLLNYGCKEKQQPRVKRFL